MAEDSRRRDGAKGNKEVETVDELDPYGAIQFGEFGKYMHAKRLNYKNAGRKFPPIFQGLTIHVNGYTKPNHNEIRRLVCEHGGSFQHYLEPSKVTHIVCSNLTPSKQHQFRNYRVVLPEWITESVKHGRLLSWTRFRLLQPKSDQRLIFAYASSPSASASSSRSNNAGESSALRKGGIQKSEEEVKTPEEEERVEVPETPPRPEPRTQERIQEDLSQTSIGAEVTWGIRFETNEQVERFLHGLAGEVSGHLREVGRRGRQLSLKVITRKDDDSHCKTITWSEASNDTPKISAESYIMFRQLNIPPAEILGLSIEISELESRGLPPISNRVEPVNEPSTQTDLPPWSQLDPEALLAMPEQMRNQMLRAYSCNSTEKRRSDGKEPMRASKRLPPNERASLLPTASQIDPDVLEELPSHVRNEILEFLQEPLPQPMARTSSTDTVEPPPRRGRGRPKKSPRKKKKFMDKPIRQPNVSAITLTQHWREGDFPAGSSTRREMPPEIDPEFLDALPPASKHSPEWSEAAREVRAKTVYSMVFSL
ncbi:uncharacterized protein VTP21DRAFT_4442 [Calcarisporiella thermophila]|uniref:uncharacterized protein n=1 Tax=Calcarisporiella thermophila TaxID=911321 RepID=UPI003742B205